MFLQIAGLICVSSLYFNWKEEQQVLTSLRDLNMVSTTVNFKWIPKFAACFLTIFFCGNQFHTDPKKLVQIHHDLNEYNGSALELWKKCIVNERLCVMEVEFAVGFLNLEPFLHCIIGDLGVIILMFYGLGHPQGRLSLWRHPLPFRIVRNK